MTVRLEEVRFPSGNVREVQGESWYEANVTPDATDYAATHSSFDPSQSAKARIILFRLWK